MTGFLAEKCFLLTNLVAFWYGSEIHETLVINFNLPATIALFIVMYVAIRYHFTASSAPFSTMTPFHSSFRAILVYGLILTLQS